MSAPRHATARWIACLLLAAGTNAHAATFCVSTGVQLANALATAGSNGQNDEIRITTGTLTGTTQVSTNPRWRYLPASSDEGTTLDVSGGWSTGNSCATQSIGTVLTQLDAEWQGPNLQVYPATESYSGRISVSNVTLARGRSFSSFGATGIHSFVTGTVSAQVLFQNVVVTSGQSTAQGTQSVLIQQNGGGVVRFRNNIVSHNTASGPGSGAGVTISAESNAIGYVSNNSIFDNRGTGQVAFGLGLGGVLTASNNAVADNTTTAAEPTYQVYATTGGGLTLRNNHFEAMRITGGAFSEVGTTTGNPQWTGIGMVRIPNEVSPLRDSGVNNPSGGIALTDIEGIPRIINGVVDRGASEADVPDELIFRNGFDS